MPSRSKLRPRWEGFSAASSAVQLSRQAASDASGSRCRRGSTSSVDWLPSTCATARVRGRILPKLDLRAMRLRRGRRPRPCSLAPSFGEGPGRAPRTFRQSLAEQIDHVGRDRVVPRGRLDTDVQGHQMDPYLTPSGEHRRLVVVPVLDCRSFALQVCSGLREASRCWSASRPAVASMIASRSRVGWPRRQLLR